MPLRTNIKNILETVTSGIYLILIKYIKKNKPPIINEKLVSSANGFSLKNFKKVSFSISF